MNYHDFLQRIAAIKQMLGSIQIPADEMHVGLMAQVHQLLNGMNDECVSCLQHAKMATQESVADAQ